MGEVPTLDGGGRPTLDQWRQDLPGTGGGGTYLRWEGRGTYLG